MKKIFGLSFLPLSPDLGLLFFRVVLSALVIRYHGWGKLTGWQNEPLHLPNVFAFDGVRKEFHTFPNYLGISSELSYTLVTWFETFGCAMILLGIFARLNALGMFITLMVAWNFHHGQRFSGSNSGELAFAFGFGFLLIFLAGPGRFSLDRKWGI